MSAYPLPRTDNFFDQLRSAKYFTKLNLRSRDHQVRLDTASTTEDLSNHTWVLRI